MSSKLCCTAEEEGRSGSPELPNARISDATPVKRPLLPKRPPSQASRFTSARSEDLHELRQIFENAKDSDSRQSPTQRSRVARPSMYSLHSLHKMKSIHALIKRKFSRDLSKTRSNLRLKEGSPKKDPINEDPDTVVKVPRGGPNVQIKITKEDLRKDLLSDKKPDEGGYDSDAEVLDDIARNIGKKTPNKRLSLHSIDWTPSTGSKHTPESAKGIQDLDLGLDIQPYQIKHPQAFDKTPLSARFSTFTSSPNLRANSSRSVNRRLRRSHSATSVELPVLSPLTPIRLPSISSNAPDVAWSISMAESLRLSQFPIPPRHLSSKPSKSSLHVNVGSADTGVEKLNDKSEASEQSAKASQAVPEHDPDDLHIRVQQSTSPRVSSSIKGSIRENTQPPKREVTQETRDEDKEDNPRRSVHLYSMRISHHLRSGSLLSWDNLADPSEVPVPPRPFPDRTISDQSRVSQKHQHTRHDRQSSSSGFASSRVPSKWGRVLPQDREHREEMSSIYSSRPQSPPDSFGGSMMNVSRSVPHLNSLKKTVADLTKRRHSDTYPTDNENPPKPATQYGITNLEAATSVSTTNPLLDNLAPPARNNSVANTKKSKFREEFSPSPRRKKSTPSATIMKLLNPKRNNVRSQSETDMKDENPRVDGPFDHLLAPSNRERRLSRSMMSLQAEQGALGKDREASPVWDRALKAHQEERSNMFLPKNKVLATQGSPFRERSGSEAKPRSSLGEGESPLDALNTSKRLSVPFLEPRASDDRGSDFCPTLFKRRSAIIHRDKHSMSPGREVQLAFDKQSDTPAIVGAWGRFPSHTRPERTLSASHLDNVQSRDFALERTLARAEQFARGGDFDDDIDPATRPESPLPIGGKRRKKRVGSGRIAKSHSMTFGKNFLRNYTKIFRSQSTEFQRHGHGHRSSVTTGGMLEYPELEILPEIWRRRIVEEMSGGNQEATNAAKGNGDDEEGKMRRADDSMATLRPKNEYQDTSTITLDGVADAAAENMTDRARVWSVYYEDCIPSFPRASTDWNSLSNHRGTDPNEPELQDFGGLSRHSFDSKRASFSRYSATLPARLAKHSRNTSHVSRISVTSHGSARPSFVSMGEADDGGVDERSIVSVRRSTMDLITLFREQEIKEQERVLSLVRGQSKRSEWEGTMAS